MIADHKDEITIASAQWAVRRGEIMCRRINGRKPTRKEKREINELLGRLAVAYRDLERLHE